MSSRMRRPETDTLRISRGDWLLVKKHLTAGEQRQIFNRMMRFGADGASVDPALVGQSKMVVYLLDWSIDDADNKPVVIRGQPPDVIAAALDAVDYDTWVEIRNAIEAHEEAMQKARDAEKNALDGGNKSSAISPSLEPLAGGTSGSPNSTAMSIAS